MTFRHFPLVKWLVVDDTSEDAADIALAIEGLAGKADIADSIKTAEKLLRKNIYDICVIDCFYKGASKWGVDLLPELRATLPGLPVVMISSSDDIELPGKLIRAGADIFCPKIKDSFSQTKALGAAALQALAIRKLKVLEANPNFNGELYLTKNVAEAISQSIRRKEERLLICGAPGAGKTRVAMFFAQNFLKHNFGNLSRNIVYHDCAFHSQETNALMLFGETFNTLNSFQLTLFERAIGGVLILDNVHALSHELQVKLKGIYDSEAILSSSGGSPLPLSLIKHVTTYLNEPSIQIVPGFLESFAHREIDLPSLNSMGDELNQLIQFVLHEFASSNNEIRIGFSAEVATAIAEIVHSHFLSANFRTLNQILSNALARALADRRSQIYVMDIEPLNTMKLQLQNISGYFKKVYAEIFDNRYGEMLINHILSGENFDEAKDFLRKIMIGVASKKHKGNKSKIAASLGISRQSLYDHEEDMK